MEKTKKYYEEKIRAYQNFGKNFSKSDDIQWLLQDKINDFRSKLLVLEIKKDSFNTKNVILKDNFNR